jgi:hypothetical protein
MLVRLEFLSADDLERATRIVLAGKKRLGQVLRDLGPLTKGASRTRSPSTFARSYQSLRPNEGAYEFEERPKARSTRS